MKHVLAIGIFVSIFLFGVTGINATSSITVTNGSNNGVGSFRSALSSGASTIHISPSVKNIIVTEELSYIGTSSLTVIGSGQTIDGSNLPINADIFVVDNGANLSLSNLSFIGNYGDVNEDPALPEGGKGIFVNVPPNQASLVRLTLKDVSLTRVGDHGIHVSDCGLGEDCITSDGDGSPASIYVQLYNVLINKVGFGKSDADGVRVDDRGAGSVFLLVKDSTFINVGADGIGVDEGDEGSVVVDVIGSIFDSNGEYCNLVEFFAGNSCDDSGNPAVDDGFDIDEAGGGYIYAYIRDTKITNNFEEGLDFDEEGDGDILSEISSVSTINNVDQGIKMSEEDSGNINVELNILTSADNNGDKEGIELEEADDGNVNVLMINSNMIDGVDEELKLEQTDDGVGTLEVIDSNVETDLDGILHQ